MRKPAMAITTGIPRICFSWVGVAKANLAPVARRPHPFGTDAAVAGYSTGGGGWSGVGALFRVGGFAGRGT